jgi:hypothetical protein
MNEDQAKGFSRSLRRRKWEGTGLGLAIVGSSNSTTAVNVYSERGERCSRLLAAYSIFLEKKETALSYCR